MAGLSSCSAAESPTQAPTSPPAEPALVMGELPASSIELPASSIELPSQGTGLLITALVPAAASAPRLFMELYRGPEPGEWVATSGGPSHRTPSVSLAIPEDGTEKWLIRVDSRPPGKGPYSIALHRPGQVPSPSFEAASADRYEGDDSWFQATPLLPGEAQGHSLGDSANPRGDEDWFVVVPSGSGL